MTIFACRLRAPIEARTMATRQLATRTGWKRTLAFTASGSEVALWGGSVPPGWSYGTANTCPEADSLHVGSVFAALTV